MQGENGALEEKVREQHVVIERKDAQIVEVEEREAQVAKERDVRVEEMARLQEEYAAETKRGEELTAKVAQLEKVRILSMIIAAQYS